MGPFHTPGTPATVRGLKEKVYWAYPVTVVQDTASLVAIYLRAGARGKNVAVRPAPRDLLRPADIRVVDHTWQRTDTLMLIVPEEAFSVYRMWEAGTRHLDCWYINLQEPIRRTAIGFDTMDHMLDIVVSPDMSSWRWKDQDEFEEAAAIGYYSPEEAREIRTAGTTALRLLTSVRNDLYEAWRNWEPDPAWSLPELARGWDQLEIAPVAPVKLD
jgi:uncharacterized protein DUF402